MPVELNSNNLFVQKREFLNITFKLNNIKYLCLSNLVRDILFQLIDQYISKKKQKILLVSIREFIYFNSRNIRFET
jgi:hypothetical protein